RPLPRSNRPTHTRRLLLIQRLAGKEQRILHRPCQLLSRRTAADAGVAVSAGRERIALPVVAINGFEHLVIITTLAEYFGHARQCRSQHLVTRATDQLQRLGPATPR